MSTGNQTAELTLCDGADCDDLGVSVAISGNTVVAGAPFHMVGGDADGGAQGVCVRDATCGVAGRRRQPDRRADRERRRRDETRLFGRDLRDHDRRRCPPATGDLSAQQGAAYVFVIPTGGWTSTGNQTAELTMNDGVASDGLGWSVAISGNTIVAGAPSHTEDLSANQGAGIRVRDADGGMDEHRQPDRGADDERWGRQ